MEQFTRTKTTRLALTAFSLFVFFTLSLTSAPRAGTVGLADAHLAVWRIHNKEPLENPKYRKYNTGTAFAISPDLFVTNDHVLRGLLLEREVPIGGIVLSREKSSTLLRINRVLRLSLVHDLAVFRTKRKAAHWLRLARRSEPLTQLIVIGYPGGRRERRMRQVGWSSKDPFAWQLQVPLDHDKLGSSSGSPVLGVDGRVVGVAHSGVSNMTTAATVEHLRDLIGKGGKGKRWVSCPKDRSFSFCYDAGIENVRARTRQRDLFAQTAQWDLYLKKLIKGDITVFDALKEAAERGLPTAQTQLGLAYHDGNIVGKDRTLRNLWYKRAAEQDEFLAQYNLAASIRWSEPNRARSLLERLVERGFVPAKALLEKMQ